MFLVAAVHTSDNENNNIMHGEQVFSYQSFFKNVKKREMKIKQGAEPLEIMLKARECQRSSRKETSPGTKGKVSETPVSSTRNPLRLRFLPLLLPLIRVQQPGLGRLREHQIESCLHQVHQSAYQHQGLVLRCQHQSHFARIR